MRLLKVISKKYNDKDVLEVENFVYEVGNVTSLTSEEVGKLQCGDIVCKKDSTGLHAYLVSFKKDGTGICLTYCDGSGYIETVSYDYTDGQWVYNSTDVFNGSEIPNVEEAPSGTINKVLGLNSSGKLVKGEVSGGTQLYKHSFNIYCSYQQNSVYLEGYFIDNESNNPTTTNVLTKMRDSLILSLRQDGTLDLISKNNNYFIFINSSNVLSSYYTGDYYNVSSDESYIETRPL